MSATAEKPTPAEIAAAKEAEERMRRLRIYSELKPEFGFEWFMEMIEAEISTAEPH
jgi:hypothetical protein